MPRIENLPPSLQRIYREQKAIQADAAPVWSPYVGGPQERAFHSKADITGYGGAAGGGKTDLSLGLAVRSHHDSIIFRRTYPQLKGIIKRSRTLFGDLGRYNGTEKTWRLHDGREIEFGAVQYDDSVADYKGRPHDLIVFDEATEFLQQQIRFLLGWMRSTIEGQRCRAVLTFNPPTNADGMWVVDFFAPWIKDDHPNPAMPGELRWFAMEGEAEVERPDGQPYDYEGETIQPLSRTFFPAKLADNPALARTNYGATLQSLPEPLRSQLLFGDFKAGIADDAWQVIPTKWIKAAFARWKATPKPDLPQTIIGMDVAHGGADKTVFAIRHGDWFAPIIGHKGVETPDGKTAASLCVKVAEPGVTINVDAIGYGASAAEKLKDDPEDGGYGLKAVAVNVASGSTFKDRSRKFKMVNKRAEMYWRLREALDPDNGSTLCLPEDPELLGDLTAPRYEIAPAGIRIEPKDKIIERLNRSPDKGDAVALAMLPPRSFEAY